MKVTWVKPALPTNGVTVDYELTGSGFDLSEAMATYWTNFAKYGNPNGKEVPDD